MLFALSLLIIESLQAPLLVNDHENGNSQNGRGSLHIDTLVPPSQVSSNSSQNSSLGSAIGDFAVPNSSYSSVANKPSDEFNIREIPWIPMLTHSASLCLLLSNWVFGWIGYMLLTELPSFLNDELGYDIESSGLLSIAPFLANLISVIIFARIFDHLQANKGWTIRGIRQTASQISYLGASFCLIICGFLTVSGNDQLFVGLCLTGAAFTFMVLSLLFFGASQSGIACCFLGASYGPLCMSHEHSRYISSLLFYHEYPWQYSWCTCRVSWAPCCFSFIK